MLASLDSSLPSQCRAKAILLLASVYGLRRLEIVCLTLQDIDWVEQVLTVRRAKRGRVQKFPLQPEMANALRDYIQEVRPSSSDQAVFLTLHAPFRPATHLGSAMRKIMNAQGAFDRDWGLHALRHSCATELLRRGFSLRGIADFLGHRGLGSVSIYAHCDQRGLRRVAALDLVAAL